MMTTATGPRLVAMIARLVTGKLRRSTASIALVALLVGGTAGIDAIGSHLSGEAGRPELSSPAPAPPTTGQLPVRKAS